MKALHTIAFILLVIGGLNWLLVGVGVGDVVMYLGSTVAAIVYVLVGLSALYLIFTHKRDCKCCDKGMTSTGGAM
ncbi:MAG: hypothetical protein RL536_168 [Candidatus Parcubacteria bacterium]|jgi:uncharacterized membrane protein YuzA (DUF378 family)